jgi:GH24 family phage-related lysozyme (muramidase)
MYLENKKMTIKFAAIQATLSGPGTKAPDSAVDPKELAIGIKEEGEHMKSIEGRKAVAKDHLLKNDPHFYSKEQAREKEEKKATIGAGVMLKFAKDPYIPPKAIPHIKANEGYRATPYKDSRGVLTQGYGNRVDLLPPQFQTNYMSPAFAQKVMESHLKNDTGRLLDHYVKAPLNDNQRTVALDYGYQHGVNPKAPFFSALMKTNYPSAAMVLKKDKEFPSRSAKNYATFIANK